MSENKLALYPSKEDMETMNILAPSMANSRFFGITPEQAIPIMLKGYELGLGYAAAFEFIHVIDGKPGLSPRGCLALIQQSSNLERMEIKDISDANGKPYACRVTMTRKNGFSYTVEFNMDDAKRAGLVKSGSGWEKYPANMLRWRTIGYCADVVFPDVTGGMKRTDELGAKIDPQGNTDLSLEAEWHEVKEAIPDYGISLPKLLELASNQDILEANGGAFPLPAQVNAVVHRLVMGGKVVLENEIPTTNPSQS